MNVEFYDRATNEPIEPFTNPKYCIEPVAAMVLYKDGKKYAAITKLRTKLVTHQYKKTLRQRLFRKPADTFTRQEFDFESAINEIRKKNEL